MKSKRIILVIFIIFSLILSFGSYKAHFVTFKKIDAIRKARPISMNVDISYNHTIDIILTQKFRFYHQLNISLEFPDKEWQNNLNDLIKESRTEAFNHLFKGFKGVSTMPETNGTYLYLCDLNLPVYQSDFLSSNSYLLTYVPSVKPGIYLLKIKIISGATNLMNVKQKLIAYYDLGGGLYPALSEIQILVSIIFLIIAVLFFLIMIFIIKKNKVSPTHSTLANC